MESTLVKLEVIPSTRTEVSSIHNVGGYHRAGGYSVKMLPSSENMKRREIAESRQNECLVMNAV